MSSKFTEEDMAAFQEMGNIGAGHAAIALTKLFSREVDMSIPFIRTGTKKEILETLDISGNEIVGYEISEINDPVKYRLSVLFKTEVIIRLLELLSTTSRDQIKSGEDLSDMQSSLIQEIGSTIILRYIAALNKMMKVESLPDTAPELVIGSANEALDNITYEGTDAIVLIQLDLFTSEYTFECQLFIEPHSDSIKQYREAFMIS